MVGPTGIELGAAFAFAVEAHPDFLYRAEVGLFAHAVDQAAGRSTPVQHRRRALDHFHPLDVGKVTVVQRIVTQAINVHVTNGAETTNSDLIALAVTVGQADARYILEHVFHRLRALVLDHTLRHDVNGLRDIAQRCVNSQCAFAFAGLVALFFVIAVDRSRRYGQGFGLQCG
ncbi:hypothetical protein D3C79_752190 [compost metagenome]